MCQLKTKMRIYVLFLTFFISSNCFSHKDKVIFETYGNVKVLMKTGFDYADIDKIKIIGHLSEKLSKQLHFKDTILIEYNQDYTNIYQKDLYMLEFNNSNFKIINGIKSKYKVESNNYGLSIRINAKKIKIKDVLKFIEFTINNKEKTNEFLVKQDIGLNNKKPQNSIEPFFTITTDEELLSKIINSNSEIIDNILNEKISIKSQEHYGIEIYWLKDKFIFEYKNINSRNKNLVFEINDYFYHKYLNNNEILIFVEKSQFYFLSGSKNEFNDLIEIENNSYVPLVTFDFGNKVLLHPFRNQNDLSIFLKEKRKLISKLD